MLLIHIGYHKTGSTWLQQRVFDNADIGYCVPWPSGREELLLVPGIGERKADDLGPRFLAAIEDYSQGMSGI